MRILDEPLFSETVSNLVAVLDYHHRQPPQGDEPPWEDMVFTTHTDGSVTVDGPIAPAIAISFPLLDMPHTRITWDSHTQALVLNVTPEPLRYRPVYVDWLHQYVICQRVADTVVA